MGNSKGGKITHKMVNGMVFEELDDYLNRYPVKIPPAALQILSRLMFPQGAPNSGSGGEEVGQVGPNGLPHQ